MNHRKYVFSQLVEFLPQRVFDRLVAKYNGNKKVDISSLLRIYFYVCFLVNYPLVRT
ncbi:DUF4372 domain-containing protein [Flavobacterium franklandianum]|uniref:DUF4372 domain-containing protein n=1 Tax=Flavobacterium franklandianum TaxID=2594430 RepID=A0A553C5U2_9FLAO|nr:DUF4372 domain-containing protein [Flavobacterium franklandianum]